MQVILLMASFLLLSCSEKTVKDSAPRPGNTNVDAIPDATPKVEPLSKYGNPKSYEVFGKTYYVMNDRKNFVEQGIASWYGKKFHGRRTSNGETYDMYAMTAAHKNLPLPSYVEVKNLKNDKKIIVRVNDRGPFHGNRIIDLSYTAASKLDIVANGTGLVEIRVIQASEHKKEKTSTKRAAPVRTASSEERFDGFYIQVGAFRNETNARRLQDKIASLGDVLIRANVNEPILYKVQIGPLYNIDKADNIVGQLGKYGITEHQIIVK